MTEARNLGVLFDCNFNFCNHITKTSSLAFYSIHNIKRITKNLTQDATKTLVQALVINRSDYCNSLLYGLPNIHINKLQRVQNAAARLVSNVSRFSHISPVLYQLHWLSVKYRVMFKIILITLKALYIRDLVQLRKQSIYNLRSNNDGRLLDTVKAVTKRKSGDRAFEVAAPSLWNTLLRNIRDESSINKFKKLLKTYI